MKDKDDNVSNTSSEHFGVWNNPEMETRLVAMLMGELSPFEEAEMEQELEKSPELRLFRDRMIEVQSLITEVNKQDKHSEFKEDWSLSTERRTSLLENFIEGKAEEAKTEEELVSTSTIQWRNVFSIAACLLISIAAFVMMFVRKGVVFKNQDEIVTYSALSTSYEMVDESASLRDKDMNVRSVNPRGGEGIDIVGGTSYVLPVDELEEEIIRKPELRPGEGVALSMKAREGKTITEFEDLNRNIMPEISNEVAKKPSTPSSSMGKVIASNTPSPSAVPLPGILPFEPSLDYGDGDDFVDGWGNGRGKNKQNSGKREVAQLEGLEADGKDFDGDPFGDASGKPFDDADRSDIALRAETTVLKSIYSEVKQANTEELGRVAWWVEGETNNANPVPGGNLPGDSAIRGQKMDDVLKSELDTTVVQKHLEYLDDPIKTSPTLTHEHTKDVEKVRKSLYRANSYYDQAQFDQAIIEYKETLRVDPYNKAARRGMEKVNAAKSDYYRAAYDQTRSAMLMEVDKAWEMAVPPAEEDESRLAGSDRLRDEEIAYNKVKSVRNKLSKTQLPLIEFDEDTTVGDAVNFLRQRASELDSDELDPTKKGLNFKFRNSTIVDAGQGLGDTGVELGGKDKIENIKIGGLKIQNVPMDEALRQIAQKTGLRYKIEGGEIALLRATDVDDNEMYARTFKVPEDILDILRADMEKSEDNDDPFASEDLPLGVSSVRDLLEMQGIKFPEGSTAGFSRDKGTLTVRNTANGLDQVEELVDYVKKSKRNKVRPGKIYLESYQALQKAEEQLKLGDTKQAMNSREAALKGYERLAREFPGWKNDLVQMRINSTKTEISNLNKLELHESKKQRQDALKEISAAQQTHSTFSLNVSDVSYKLAKSALLEKGVMPEADKIRVEEFVNAFDYGDPSASGKKVNCVVEQCAHPFYQQRNLMRIGMKTGAMGRSQPLRLTVLLDNSGSMEREDRAATVVKAVEALASQLGPQDEVTLLSFARGARLVAQKVKGDQAHQLVNLVRDIPSEGGTNLSLAIEQAYQTAQQSVQAGTMSRIVIITDGAANLGNADPEELSKSVEKMRQNGIAFDACGVGADGLDDDMLEALTRKGDGRYYFINRPEDADAGFAQKLAGALRPAAKNVKVQVVFNPERVGNYRLVGFEKHRLKKEDFRNDAVDAAEMAAEEAGNALYQVEARPDGNGDVGTVFVRFRDMATGQMVERSWAIPYQPNINSLSSAAPSMQLATVAGMLGERLKQGEEAGIDIKQLKPIYGMLRSHFHADKEVKDLIRMCEKVISNQ